MAVPSMWREELLHPLTVHFPIALLLCAAVLTVLRIFFPERPWLRVCQLFLLCTGVPSGWFSVYAGQIAEDVVNRVICDPTVTHAHEDLAKQSMWVFSALLAVVLAELRIRKLGGMVVFRLLCGVLAGVGAFLLVRTSHLGASLVYQQGAGAYRPSEECTEFE